MVQAVQAPPQTTQEILPIVLRLHPVIQLTEEEFATFCEQNQDVRIERRCTGELELMSPTKGYTGNHEAEVVMQLGIWAKRDGTGIFFGSTAGFTLPNRAMRSPDASWILKTRLALMTPEDENRSSCRYARTSWWKCVRLRTGRELSRIRWTSTWKTGRGWGC